MNDSLLKKEKQAIRLLQSFRGDQIEVSYSGGKDSDVILALAKMAGINYQAIYKSTTIDPPGTIQHAIDNGAEIVRPKKSFFQLIREKGAPNRRMRFCCEQLKEYKIHDNAILGIRKSESAARAKRYKEPVICWAYSKGEKSNIYLPILEWNDNDVKEFITYYGIKLHSLYYDGNGDIDCKRRLGCIGCPLQSQRLRKLQFMKYPKMLKQYIRNLHIYLENHPDVKAKRIFKDEYGIMYKELFCGGGYDFEIKTNSLFGRRDLKQEMSDYFKIEL